MAEPGAGSAAPGSDRRRGRAQRPAGPERLETDSPISMRCKLIGTGSGAGTAPPPPGSPGAGTGALERHQGCRRRRRLSCSGSRSRPMNDDGQNEITALLCSRQGFGTGQPPDETISTHISTVLLLGEHALKLKRPVRLPYLDLSSPQRRLELCERELELNRRTAPHLYRRVHRITREPDGRLALNGSGPLVDAVLEMRRFDGALLFDRLAAAGQLTAAQIEALANAIAAFHRSAPVATDPDGAARLRHVLDVNARAFAAAHLLPPGAVAEADAACRAALLRHADLLDRRARDGRVRRVHGDLHLRNICLIGGEPTLFDCLEFDEELATTDLLYDLAFVLMDLWHRGAHDLANVLFNRYLDATGDEAGIVLLPLFMAVRAAVRAHVTASAAAADEAGPQTCAEARAYLDLCRDLLRETPASLTAIGGYSGSGKSTVAAEIAPSLGVAPGARVVSSDRFRKRQFGATPQTRLPADAYASEVSARVYAELGRTAELVLAGGHAVVADAVFDRPADRDHFAGIAAAAGVAFRGIWLDAPETVLVERVKARRGDPSDATAAVVAQQLARGGAATDWTVIRADADAGSVAAAVKAALAEVARRRG
ncbi:bifunctional aminoglycoside phosphotransferase/ATP-binding protein [Bosea sp. CS1GBMeth4]|uniref:bifunctional aminoglycoside phosphotransferase/ATP-binding protein n=1 Tax=Bosea sp. CS1GBMeth4 TaxID=1892849 RepID=UPI0016446654|nr:bifunctional aminoglycoside phosphotransferase/ATP-binding protein [Bosea sp. CS1GBMeth4]